MWASVFWDFRHCGLIVQGDRGDREWSVVESPAASGQTKAQSRKGETFEDDKQPAEEARRLMVEDAVKG